MCMRRLIQRRAFCTLVLWFEQYSPNLFHVGMGTQTSNYCHHNILSNYCKFLFVFSLIVFLWDTDDRSLTCKSMMVLALNKILWCGLYRILKINQFTGNFMAIRDIPNVSEEFFVHAQRVFIRLSFHKREDVFEVHSYYHCSSLLFWYFFIRARSLFLVLNEKDMVSLFNWVL